MSTKQYRIWITAKFRTSDARSANTNFILEANYYTNVSYVSFVEFSIWMLLPKLFGKYHTFKNKICWKKNYVYILKEPIF